MIELFGIVVVCDLYDLYDLYDWYDLYALYALCALYDVYDLHDWYDSYDLYIFRLREMKTPLSQATQCKWMGFAKCSTFWTKVREHTHTNIPTLFLSLSLTHIFLCSVLCSVLSYNLLIACMCMFIYTRARSGRRKGEPYNPKITDRIGNFL